ncbi:MAG: MATE family efflux transporter [Sphaerochaeta sp.]|nr:MATE family efflux transporter [Sphaerochaeta sp.]MDX9914917.1 MATE family efflux transporter [Sphaerochaeta sp.]
MGTHTQLMTRGSIKKNLISFAIPIFLGNLLQQLYQTIDSLVVGNFVSREALAAISSIGSLTMLLVGLFQGIFVGAGVVISRSFGEGNKDSVEKAVHTTMALALISSLLLTVFGYRYAPVILSWMKTPSDVFIDAEVYIRIIFAGISTLVLYNTASGILQAVGDSRNPLKFLAVSAVLNIVLDLLFVLKFKLGVAGVAYATIIAQAVSVVLSFRLLFTTRDLVRVEIRKIAIHRRFVAETLRLGIPSGIQNSVTSFANVILQYSINLFGAAAIAGNGAFMRIQGFAFIPITAFALALTTFTSQNLGAGAYGRVREGARFGIIFSMVVAEVLGLAMYFGAAPLVALFSRDPQVIFYGVQKAQIISLLLFPLALSHAMAGLYRGAGKSIVPMLVMLAVWCVFRIIFIQVGLAIFHDIRVVFWAYPVTWSISSVIFVIYYFTVDWMGQKSHERAAA